MLPSPGQSENGFLYVSHFTLLLPLLRGQQKENCLSGNSVVQSSTFMEDKLVLIFDFNVPQIMI